MIINVSRLPFFACSRFVYRHGNQYVLSSLPNTSSIISCQWLPFYYTTNELSHLRSKRTLVSSQSLNLLTRRMVSGKYCHTTFKITMDMNFTLNKKKYKLLLLERQNISFLTILCCQIFERKECFPLGYPSCEHAVLLASH